jgi:hypothetical protein
MALTSRSYQVVDGEAPKCKGVDIKEKSRRYSENTAGAVGGLGNIGCR